MKEGTVILKWPQAKLKIGWLIHSTSTDIWVMYSPGYRPLTNSISSTPKVPRASSSGAWGTLPWGYLVIAGEELLMRGELLSSLSKVDARVPPFLSRTQSNNLPSLATSFSFRLEPKLFTRSSKILILRDISDYFWVHFFFKIKK